MRAFHKNEHALMIGITMRSNSCRGNCSMEYLLWQVTRDFPFCDRGVLLHAQTLTLSG